MNEETTKEVIQAKAKKIDEFLKEIGVRKCFGYMNIDGYSLAYGLGNESNIERVGMVRFLEKTAEKALGV